MPATSPLKFEVDALIPLDSDPSIQVSVKFNTAVARMASTYNEALLISREIGDDTSIIPAHPDAVLIATQSRGKYTTKQAVRFVKHAFLQFREEALDHALKIAMLNDLFDVRDANGKRISGTKFPIEVPPEYWDDTDENEARLAAWIPPLRQKNPDNPIEKRAAIVNTLLDQNPIFASKFRAVFSDAVAALMDTAIAQGIKESEDTDDAGFQPNNVGGDLDAASQPAD